MSLITSERTVSINDLRRRFGEIERELPFVDRFILTKKGKPFAVLSATRAAKREIMKDTAGAFKNTSFDRDDFWKEILKKKSRKKKITL